MGGRSLRLPVTGGWWPVAGGRWPVPRARGGRSSRATSRATYAEAETPTRSAACPVRVRRPSACRHLSRRARCRERHAAWRRRSPRVRHRARCRCCLFIFRAAHHLRQRVLRVAEGQHGVRGEEELVLDAGEARAHGALQHDAGAGEVGLCAPASSGRTTKASRRNRWPPGTTRFGSAPMSSSVACRLAVSCRCSALTSTRLLADSSRLSPRQKRWSCRCSALPSTSSSPGCSFDEPPSCSRPGVPAAMTQTLPASASRAPRADACRMTGGGRSCSPAPPASSRAPRMAPYARLVSGPAVRRRLRGCAAPVGSARTACFC